MSPKKKKSPKKGRRSKRRKLELSSPSSSPTPQSLSPPDSPSPNPSPSVNLSPSANPPPIVNRVDPSPSANLSPSVSPPRIIVNREDSRDVLEILESDAKVLNQCLASMTSLKLEAFTPPVSRRSVTAAPNSQIGGVYRQLRYVLVSPLVLG